MSLIGRIKRWFKAMFKTNAEEIFQVSQATTPTMDSVIAQCARIYGGVPDWVKNDDNISTVNFAKTVCSETARLATLAINITIDGSARAEWLQEQIDRIYYQLRHWTEYACAYGTVILKPTVGRISIVLPEDFIVTEQVNEQVLGAVFIDHAAIDKQFYTRLEYHRFEDDIYVITNRFYVSNSSEKLGNACDASDTPWEGIEPEVAIQNLEKPLFAVLRTPQANNLDIGSSLGLPIYGEAIEELKDLDVAYSRNAKEIFDSKRTILLDSDRLIPTGTRVGALYGGFDSAREAMQLPDYVKMVYGNGQDEFYQEINPTLNTEVRIKGINNLLSQIGFKCGFSNGYFVFDEKTGMMTATQVEADDRRTIQLIKDIRDKIESCLDDLIYAVNVFADLYGLAPAGDYEVVYDFGDIVYNREEDKIRWWQYVQANKVPAWLYFVKFEGMSEDDAKAMVTEAAPNAPPLFGEE